MTDRFRLPPEWERRHSAGDVVDKNGNNVLSLERGKAGEQSKREVLSGQIPNG